MAPTVVDPTPQVTPSVNTPAHLTVVDGNDQNQHAPPPPRYTLDNVTDGPAQSSTGKRRGAWVTLMTGDVYLPGLAVFAHSLLRSHHASKFPLVVMLAQNSVSDEAIKTVHELGCETVIVPPIATLVKAESLAAERFSQVWTKLRVWDLQDLFERCVLVDSDMLVRRNMDELFDIELPRHQGPGGGKGVAASFACTCNPAKIKTYPAEWIPDNCAFTPQSHPTCLTDPTRITPDSRPTHHLLNSGLVVLEPSHAALTAMLHEIDSDPRVKTYRFPDQDFIAAFYHGAFRPIPYVYNALKKLRIAHPAMWRDEEVKNVHYILQKPWDHQVGRDIGGPDQEAHSWWWQEWEKCCIDRAGGVSPERWASCVQRYVTAK
ncbi:unnamed protein product [Sympodiomycopsis kandeliae]